MKIAFWILAFTLTISSLWWGTGGSRRSSFVIETEAERIARVTARENPNHVPDPLIHPDIRGQWVIQYNDSTKKYRPFWLYCRMPLWFECDTREEAAQKLNEYHRANVRAANGGWETVTP